MYVAACLAHGIEARYVCSFPPDDHAWAEIKMNDEWLAVETVDGYITVPFRRYDQGFNVTKVIAYEPFRYVDVTDRYVRSKVEP